MKFNEYERKLLISLGHDVDDFDIGYLGDYLTNVYWDIDNEEKLQQVMVAVSYIKRLLQKVCEKRNIPYDVDDKVDLVSVLEGCKSEYYRLKELDVSKVIDEKELSENIDTLIGECDYEQVNSLANEFGFFYKSFHQYMVNHILVLLDSYIEYYYETKEPENDPFLDAIFSSESTSDEQVLDDGWDDDWGDLVFDDEIETVHSIPVQEKKKLTDEELVELLTFLNSIFDMIKVHTSFAHNTSDLTKKVNQKKLDEYYDDTEFMERFTAMMQHDKSEHTYRFHGTTCLEDAKSICEQGLGVMRNDLDSTSYRELTMDEVILHQRGFGGEIGRDAYIIIDEPKGIQILEPLQEGEKVNFAGSGLQGFDAQANNIVRNKYIIGYVDKKNKKIIFNPEYYDYERFAEYTSIKSV